MFKYFIPPNEVSQFFDEDKIKEAQSVQDNISFHPLLEELKIHKFYEQGYSVEYLADLLTKLKNTEIQNYPFFAPNIFSLEQKRNIQSLKPFINVNNLDFNIIKSIQNADEFTRSQLIDTIHSFSLKKLDFSLSAYENGIVYYNKYHIAHALKNGVKLSFPNKVEHLSHHAIKDIDFGFLLNSIGEIDSLSTATTVVSENISFDEIHKINPVNLQNYVSIKTSSLNKKENAKAIELITQYLEIVKQVENNSTTDNEYSNNNGFIPSMNIASGLISRAYYNLLQEPSHVTYGPTDFMIDYQFLIDYSNPEKNEILNKLTSLAPKINSEKTVEFLLFDEKSIYNPMLLELIAFLYNFYQSCEPKDYNSENIVKKVPNHLHKIFNDTIEAINTFSSKLISNSNLENISPCNAFVLIYPLLNKTTQIDTLPILNHVIPKNAKTKNGSQHVEDFNKFLQFHLNDLNGKNTIHSFIPFSKLSFEDVVKNAPNLLSNLTTGNTEGLHKTELPYFIANAIKHLHKLCDKDTFKKTIDISFQDLHTCLNLIHQSLSNTDTRRIVEFICDKNIDISLFTKEKTPLLLQKFTDNVNLSLSPNDSHYYSSSFFTIIEDTINEEPDFFINANLKLLQSYIDSKPSYPLSLTSLAKSFGFNNPVQLFSKDLKEVPLILDKYPEFKDYVINAKVIGHLLEIDSQHIQHPEIQKFLRSYNGINILTDHEYSRPSLEKIFPVVTEEEKKKFSQFFINPEVFILDGLYKDTQWINYLSQDSLSDPEYVIEVINQTKNFYGNNNSILDTMKFLNALPNNFWAKDNNFETVFNALFTDKNFANFTSLCEKVPQAFQHSNNVVFLLSKISNYVENKDFDQNNKDNLHYNLLISFLDNLYPGIKEKLPGSIPSDSTKKETLFNYVFTAFEKIVMHFEKNDSQVVSTYKKPSVKF